MPAEHTFMFADLAGYTALTEAMGDAEAADLVDEFCREVRALLPGFDAEGVKAIGDALMIRASTPPKAVALGLRIASDIGSRHNFPEVRVGMHTGAAIERGGDWFGSTVNVAARVSGAARGGEVLLTDATRDRVGDVPGVEIEDYGELSLKNVPRPLRIFSARAAGAVGGKDLPIDPVCRMAVEPGRGAGMLRHEGRDYHFCSLGCARAFAEDPTPYVAAAG